MSGKPECCPKCGGTSGVYALEWQRWTLLWSWSGEPCGGDCIDSKGGNMLYCQDCGKPIMRATTFLKEDGE